MINVKYTGAALDQSGYGEAVRHDIGALLSVGIDVTTEIPRFSYEIADFGQLGDLAKNREGKRINFKIKIIHVTPNIIGKFLEPDKYHIARVIWETTKLPPAFSEPLKNVDEIWTASEYTKQAIINSGVKKPIYIIPEAIDATLDFEKVLPFISGQEDSYKFYSIFEWTERKNPGALLQAYWSEFQNNENVSLTLKTFVDSFHPKKRQEILNDIKMLKKKMGLSKFPPVYIYIRLLDRYQIYRFHKSFDCFVSAHRGEGWGIPQMEALLTGNPVISTNCGGIHEYLTPDEHAKLISWQSVPLKSNSRNHQWYLPDQNWADINIEELRKALRWAYENQQSARNMARKGNNFIKEKFNLVNVGEWMKKRLLEIKT